MVKSLAGLGELFKGCHFEREIIILCVRWYLRFKLSLRDPVEMMAERGQSLAHTTIMRWVNQYVAHRSDGPSSRFLHQSLLNDGSDRKSKAYNRAYGSDRCAEEKRGGHLLSLR